MTGIVVLKRLTGIPTAAIKPKVTTQLKATVVTAIAAGRKRRKATKSTRSINPNARG